MIFLRKDIDLMSKTYRGHFINGLSGYKSSNLLGTVNATGQTNLAIISSAFHLGADPPLMGFINRPDSVERHSLSNILETGSYTLNHVHTAMIDQAHQTSARYPEEQSEFDACGFKPQWQAGVTAPFVSESLIKIGLRYVEHHRMLNDTLMVIGEVVSVELPEEVINAEGVMDISLANTIASGGLDTYYSAKKVKRLSYAKPDRVPLTLDD
ncbi:flavin reductase family protein [Oceanicoccus sp.]|uniref:flavin reductase family protein n=2 Tax=Oceanicoccus sp. TaxID=2691044 RepID=UPI00262A0EA9|nr:flavin reductase family protein [Oceanicoccus sp.]